MRRRSVLPRRRVQVGDVDVVEVDALYGEQRREFAQRFLRRPWLELDLRRSGQIKGGSI